MLIAGGFHTVPFRPFLIQIEAQCGLDERVSAASADASSLLLVSRQTALRAQPATFSEPVREKPASALLDICGGR
jgi:hypothetical protein